MRKFKLGFIGLLLAMSVNSFAAGVVSPSSTPLETGVASAVKPNIMFVLDDSGSMAWDYLGDEIKNESMCKSVSLGSWSNWSNITSQYVNSTACTTALASYTNTPTEEYRCDSRRIQKRTKAVTISNFQKVCRKGSGDNMNTTSSTPEPLFFAYELNKQYYNPDTIYQPAVTSTGSSMGDQTLAAAKSNVFSSNSVQDITTIKEVYYCNVQNPTAAQLSNNTICKRNGIDTAPGNGVAFNYYTDGYPKDGYIYPAVGQSAPFYYKIIPSEFCNYNGVNCSSSQSVSNPKAFPIRWCSTAAYATQATVPTGAGKCQGNYDKNNFTYPRIGKIQRFEVSAGQATNYANWWTYYRTRINAAKTSIGIAFQSLDTSKRIGFFGMNTKAFVPLADFNQTQKDEFYTKLYAETANSGTNLKGVVSAMGRYFANKTTSRYISSIPADPVQYSCQQNFTILATDGYWNTGTNGVNLSGNTIGNIDNNNTAETYDLRSEGAYDGGLSGASGTLADVALYYYKTPLRSASLNNCSSSSSGSAQNLCPTQPNVPISSADTNPYIHMNFFAMSLGLNGLMTYTKDYYRGAALDLENIKNSVAATGGVCSWTTGTCNWPVPGGDDPAALDDLWHATINGRGRFFNANSTIDIISGLQDALAAVTAMTGASAAAATSSPNITATNNFLYYTTYRTLKWDGEIAAKTIDPNTGVLSSNISWSARTLLNSKVSQNSDTRTISFVRNVSSGAPSSTLVGFNYSNMTTTEKNYFDNKANAVPYSQYSGLSSANQALANNGANLVNYLRGQSGYEESNATSPLYRSRDYVLGDIVDTAPQYVGGAKYNWTDSGYASFITAQVNRTPTIYVGSNDGMIHAFNANTGQENWALIPGQVLSKIHKLADSNYNYNHQFFVDGNITVMDAKINGNWKTVMVVGMGSGGKGYIALDITNPMSPIPLWEICTDSTVCSRVDSELGYSYSNPIVTKRAFDDKWVVYVTSGYDNSTGKGILYELDLETGAILRKLYVGTGSAGAVSVSNQVGLGKINALFDDFSTTNVAKAIYAGDLNGDIWKFDLTSSSSTTGVLLATAKNAAGQAQPITTKPEIGKIDSNIILYVGTGRYLNGDDQSTTSQQSFYAFKDTNANLGVLRNDPKMVQQIITPSAITSTGTTNPVDWAVNDGWYFDFNSQAGERVNIDPILVLGNINIITNVPYSTACTAGGNSWYYQVNFSTGHALPGQSNIIAKKLTGGLTVGQNIVILSGPQVIKNYITDAQGNVTPNAVAANPGTGTTRVAKKVSWREFLKR